MKHPLSDIKNIRFSYFGTGARNMKPVKTVTLEYFLKELVSDKNKTVYEQIAAAEAAGDTALKAKLKQSVTHVYTPCVVIGEYKPGIKSYSEKEKFKESTPWKDYSHIQKFTGLLVLDFDHLKSYDIDPQELKQDLFEAYDFFIAVWLSPSRNGLKCLISIPVVNSVNEFQDYFRAIESELGTVDGFDTTVKNPTLSLFQSYDPEPLIAKHYTTWTKKLPQQEPQPVKEVNIPQTGRTNREKEIVLKSIATMFNHVTSANGHDPLRKLSKVVGGYVASGYLDKLEALQILDWGIESHGYLSKKAKTYKKTARTFLEYGLLEPLQI